MNKLSDKMKSRKFIFAVWAAVTFTGLGAMALIKEMNAGWLTSSLPVLPIIVGAFVGVEGKKEWKK